MVSRDFPIMRSVFVVRLSHWMPWTSWSRGASLWWGVLIGVPGRLGHKERLCGGTFALVSRGFPVRKSVFVVELVQWCPRIIILSRGTSLCFGFLTGVSGFPGREERLCGLTFSLLSRDSLVMRSVFVVGLSLWLLGFSKSCGAFLVVGLSHCCPGTFLVMRNVFVAGRCHWCPGISRS